MAPTIATHLIASRLVGADQSLHTHTQIMAWLPGILGSYLRVAFLRFALQECHPTATICIGSLFSSCHAMVAAHVYVGPWCNLGMVTLEQDVLLGPSVHIPSGPETHGIESLELPIRLQPGRKVRVTIGRDSWIGAGSIVLADVAPQSVVGAGSVVTKPFPPQVIVVGNPARVLRSRAS